MRGPPAPRLREGAAGSHTGIPGGARKGRAVEGIVELIAIAVGRYQLRCQCGNRLNVNISQKVVKAKVKDNVIG